MNWTYDSAGSSNSSPKFLEICDEVERLIRSSAHTLISGNADHVARLIVAQLAHVHGMTPSSVSNSEGE